MFNDKFKGTGRRVGHAILAMALTSSIAMAAFNLGFDGKIISQGVGPVLSACGGAVAGDAGSSDTAGTVTQGGTVTTCTITFGVAFASAPSCIVQDMTAVRASMATAVTTTAITITAITAGDKLSWLCFAKAGG